MDMDMSSASQSALASYTFARSLFAGIALLTYSIVISFDREKKYIWGEKFTIATLLYCLAQYATLVSLIVGLMPVFTKGVSACNSFTYAGYVFEILGYIGIQGIFIARAIAVARYSNLKWIATGVLGSVFCAAVVLSIIPILLAPGCIVQAGLVVRCISIRPSMNVIISVDYSKLTLSQNILTLVIETIVSAIIVHATFDTFKREYHGGKSNSPIAQVLLKQGALRYLYVTIAGAVNLFLVAKNITTIPVEFWNTLQSALAAIIVCQFTVELRRRCSAQAIGSDMTQTMIWSTTTGSMHIVFQAIDRFHRSIQDSFGDRPYERNESSPTAAEQLLETKSVEPLYIRTMP